MSTTLRRYRDGVEIGAPLFDATPPHSSKSHHHKMKNLTLLHVEHAEFPPLPAAGTNRRRGGESPALPTGGDEDMERRGIWGWLLG